MVPHLFPRIRGHRGRPRINPMIADDAASEKEASAASDDEERVEGMPNDNDEEMIQVMPNNNLENDDFDPIVIPEGAPTEANDTEQICIICCDRSGQFAMVQCGHWGFCLVCILQWKLVCPLCKVKSRHMLVPGEFKKPLENLIPKEKLILCN